MDTPTLTSAPPVIEMKDVAVGSLQDAEQIVLEGINWTVKAGDYWVVAGMHGSGKSDLISMTGGLMPPMRGDYRLFGHPMPIYDEELLPERLRLGMVFESGQLLHQLSVKENIALPLRYQRELPWQEVEDRVNAMLELTELSPYADARPGTLTHNWQKRAGLARALMLEPEVLLLNHPLGGLDLRHAGWWLNFLDQLATGQGLFPGRRLTLVVTAEDLRPWRDLACSFAILKKQRFTVLGHRPEFRNHEEPLVKELLAEELPRG